MHPLHPPPRSAPELGAACELLPKSSKSFFFQYSVLTKTNLEINFTTKTGARLDVFKWS